MEYCFNESLNKQGGGGGVMNHCRRNGGTVSAHIPLFCPQSESRKYICDPERK